MASPTAYNFRYNPSYKGLFSFLWSRIRRPNSLSRIKTLARSRVRGVGREFQILEFETASMNLSVRVVLEHSTLCLIFDPYVSTATLIEDLHLSTQFIREDLSPKARSLFHVRLCFGSRKIELSLLNQIRTYIQEQLLLSLYGIECTQDSLCNLTGQLLDIQVELPKSRQSSIHSSIRSGQSLSCEGDIIIYGDVHRGASLETTGNITVMGKVSGSLHAGKDGDRVSSIYALSFDVACVHIAGEYIPSKDFINEDRFSHVGLHV